MKKINFFRTLLGLLAFGAISAFSAIVPSEEETVTVHRYSLKSNQKEVGVTKVSLKIIRDQSFLYFETPDDMVAWAQKQEEAAAHFPVCCDIILKKTPLPLKFGVGNQLIFFSSFEEFGPDYYFNQEEYKRGHPAELPLPSDKLGVPAVTQPYEFIKKQGGAIKHSDEDLQNFFTSYVNARSIALMKKRDKVDSTQEIPLCKEISATNEYWFSHKIPMRKDSNADHTFSRAATIFLKETFDCDQKVLSSFPAEIEWPPRIKMVPLYLKRLIQNCYDYRLHLATQLKIGRTPKEKEILRKVRAKSLEKMIKFHASLFTETKEETYLRSGRKLLLELKVEDSESYSDSKKLLDSYDDAVHRDEHRKKISSTLRSKKGKEMVRREEHLQVQRMAQQALKGSESESVAQGYFDIETGLKELMEIKEVDQVSSKAKQATVLKLIETTESNIVEKWLDQEVLPARGEELFEKIFEASLGAIRNNGLYKNGVGATIKFFIQSGNFEEALVRTSAFKRTLEKIDDKDVAFFEGVVACLKNLQGDPTEFNEILERREKEKAERRAQKEVKKQKGRKIITSLVRAAQEIALKANDSTLEVIVPKRNLPSVSSKPLPEFRNEKETDSAAEKAARHATAVARREREAQKEIPDASGACAAPESSSEEETESSEEDVRPLGNLMVFTHLTADVDKEIEGNSWRFTREDLIRYYAQFGCSFSQAGTSHVVARFPELRESMNIVVKTKTGDLLTILISPDVFKDFTGGAATLPDWNKNFVPYYMRPQILAARAKLKAIVATALEQAPDGARVSIIQ